MKTDIHQALREVFGFTRFQGEQEAAITAALAGEDSLVLMPTGGGKSLCFQIPALIRNGTGLVVSPLIALMEDQVDALRELGLDAAFLNSTLTPAEKRRLKGLAVGAGLDVSSYVLARALPSSQSRFEVVLRSLFDALYNHNVMLEGTILKASMVLPGKDCPEQASVEEVAESTLMCLKSAVPAILPGIVFLSGGQSDELATEHLNGMNKGGPLPGKLSFSYGRALQAAPLKAWAGKPANLDKGQQAFLKRAKDNAAAAQGRYAA